MLCREGKARGRAEVPGRVLYVGVEGLRLPVWKLSSRPPIHVSSGAWELLSCLLGEGVLRHIVARHGSPGWLRKRTGSAIMRVESRFWNLVEEGGENQGNGWAAAEQGPRHALSRPGTQL